MRKSEALGNYLGRDPVQTQSWFIRYMHIHDDFTYIIIDKTRHQDHNTETNNENEYMWWLYDMLIEIAQLSNLYSKMDVTTPSEIIGGRI